MTVDMRHTLRMLLAHLRRIVLQVSTCPCSDGGLREHACMKYAGSFIHAAQVHSYMQLRFVTAKIYRFLLIRTAATNRAMLARIWLSKELFPQTPALTFTPNVTGWTS